MIKTTIKTLFHAYTLSMHIKSLTFAFFSATIMMAPWFAILTNLLLMYIQYAYHILFIMTLSFSGWALLMIYLYGKTLQTYRQEPAIGIKQYCIIIGIPFALLIFVIALLLMITLPPRFL